VGPKEKTSTSVCWLTECAMLVGRSINEVPVARRPTAIHEKPKDISRQLSSSLLSCRSRSRIVDALGQWTFPPRRVCQRHVWF
jgi:hypothetical protein